MSAVQISSMPMLPANPGLSVRHASPPPGPETEHHMQQLHAALGSKAQAPLPPQIAGSSPLMEKSNSLQMQHCAGGDGGICPLACRPSEVRSFHAGG